MSDQRLAVIVLGFIWLCTIGLIGLAMYFKRKATKSEARAIKAELENKGEDIEDDVRATPISVLIDEANKRRRKNH